MTIVAFEEHPDDDPDVWLHVYHQVIDLIAEHKLSERAIQNIMANINAECLEAVKSQMEYNERYD